MFKFSDLLPPSNPLFNKKGLIIDYSIRRNVMFQMADTNSALPKRQYDFLVDCSGSMAGSAINQTKIALEKALTKLLEGPQCYITLTKFGNNSQSWRETAFPLNTQTMEEALTWVRNLSANMGGTEMLRAVQRVSFKILRT